MWAQVMHAGRAGPRPSAASHSRRFHRIVALIFTASVALNFLIMPFGPPPAWITYAPLLPLLLLTSTGLVMLAARRRRHPGNAR